MVKTSENLLRPDGFTPFEKGGQQQGEVFLCDNGSDRTMVRGFSQAVVLSQTNAEPFLVRAYSKAEGVTGTPDSDYALYLDIRYEAGKIGSTQAAPFSVGTHDWQFREILRDAGAAGSRRELLPPLP